MCPQQSGLGFPVSEGLTSLWSHRPPGERCRCWEPDERYQRWNQTPETKERGDLDCKLRYGGPEVQVKTTFHKTIQHFRKRHSISENTTAFQLIRKGYSFRENTSCLWLDRASQRSTAVIGCFCCQSRNYASWLVSTRQRNMSQNISLAVSTQSSQLLISVQKLDKS